LSDTVLQVDHDRWGQTQTDLRELALNATHARSRERFLALHEIAEGACATQVAMRTGRHPQTVMGWLHADNEHGPAALTDQRSGGRPPLSRYRCRAWRAGSRRATPGGQSARRRSRGKATLDVAASG